jgi:hypothetical protein
MRKGVLQVACSAVVAMMVVQSGHAQVVAPIGDSVDGHIFRILDEPARDPVLVAQRDGDSMPQFARDNAASRDRYIDEGIDGSNDRLIDRAVDPISWLTQFRFRQDWNWPLASTGLDSQEFQFRPTIPFKAWDQVNILRIRIPYMTQGNDAPGLGKVEMEDAVVFTPEWGRWGVGPAWRFDPDSGSGGDFQIGPVVGAVAKTKHWTYGFISQNWLGGSDSETDIQPILAYKFNERWALALGEMQFKYDWTDRTWKQVPLGIELNWISDICGQKIEWFVNPQYNFESTSSNSGWTIYLGLVLLVPGA